MSDKDIEKIKEIAPMILFFSSLIMVITGLGAFLALIWNAPDAVAMFFGRVALSFFALDVVFVLFGLVVMIIFDT